MIACAGCKLGFDMTNMNYCMECRAPYCTACLPDGGQCPQGHPHAKVTLSLNYGSTNGDEKFEVVSRERVTGAGT